MLINPTMRISFFSFIFLLFANYINAQVTEIPAPNYIKSIIFHGEDELNGVPIIELGERLFLEFDDIIGDEANYYYRIEHYNFDWTPTRLAESEYLNGFDNVRIFSYQNSFNTLQLYSHYELSIPNADTQGITLSGNYILSIYDDQENLVFSRKFIVYEPIARVPVFIKRARDLQFIEDKQVVQFNVESPNLILQNPEENVHALVIKNNNLKWTVPYLEPQYTVGNTLIYKYDQAASFWGGNEFLAFDSKDLRAANMYIRRVALRDLYHHFLFTDIVRAFKPYTYNPDINGGYVVRTLDGDDDDIEAEYVWVHFSLALYEPLDGGELHVYGGFNNYNITEETKLHYNEETGLYEAALLLKQGFYNYKYVLVKDGLIVPGYVSGNFDETENKYTVVIYYRDVGARYDRVIGVGTGSSLNIQN